MRSAGAAASTHWRTNPSERSHFWSAVPARDWTAPAPVWVAMGAAGRVPPGYWRESEGPDDGAPTEEAPQPLAQRGLGGADPSSAPATPSSAPAAGAPGSAALSAKAGSRHRPRTAP